MSIWSCYQFINGDQRLLSRGFVLKEENIQMKLFTLVQEIFVLNLFMRVRRLVVEKQRKSFLVVFTVYIWMEIDNLFILKMIY